MLRSIRAITLLAAAVLVLGAILIVAWHLRERRTALFTDGATIRRPIAGAEARSVLWREAEALRALNTALSEHDPRISADGATLYLVRGEPGGAADLWSATRESDGWSEPFALAALNSEADELGPEPSPDGDALWFASDRAGGFGGFDLWVARRSNGEWSEPANAGPTINTPYDDYAPALARGGPAQASSGPAQAPGATALYFASNRPEGDTTERGDFDIYGAEISAESIAPAKRLDELSSPHDEGGPALSGAGDFVYFASDRPGGFGGFDLWRSRRAGNTHAPPVNLGSSVNGPANDIAPGLAMEGFGLYFGSDRASAGADGAHARGDLANAERHRYDLYYTTSREVYADVERHRASIDWAAVLAAGLWLACGVLLLVVVALLVRLRRSVWYGRLGLMARCILFSCVVHMMILVLLTMWGVSGSIGEWNRFDRGARVTLVSSSTVSDVAGQLRGDLTRVELVQSSPTSDRALEAYASEADLSESVSLDVDEREAPAPEPSMAPARSRDAAAGLDQEPAPVAPIAEASLAQLAPRTPEAPAPSTAQEEGASLDVTIARARPAAPTGALAEAPTAARAEEAPAQAAIAPAPNVQPAIASAEARADEPAARAIDLAAPAARGSTALAPVEEVATDRAEEADASVLAQPDESARRSRADGLGPAHPTPVATAIAPRVEVDRPDASTSLVDRASPAESTVLPTTDAPLALDDPRPPVTALVVAAPAESARAIEHEAVTIVEPSAGHTARSRAQASAPLEALAAGPIPEPPLATPALDGVAPARVGTHAEAEESRDAGAQEFALAAPPDDAIDVEVAPLPSDGGPLDLDEAPVRVHAAPAAALAKAHAPAAGAAAPTEPSLDHPTIVAPLSVRSRDTRGETSSTDAREAPRPVVEVQSPAPVEAERASALAGLALPAAPNDVEPASAHTEPEALGDALAAAAVAGATIERATSAPAPGAPRAPSTVEIAPEAHAVDASPTRPTPFAVVTNGTAPPSADLPAPETVATSAIVVEIAALPVSAEAGRDYDNEVRTTVASAARSEAPLPEAPDAARARTAALLDAPALAGAAARAPIAEHEHDVRESKPTFEPEVLGARSSVAPPLAIAAASPDRALFALPPERAEPKPSELDFDLSPQDTTESRAKVAMRAAPERAEGVTLAPPARPLAAQASASREVSEARESSLAAGALLGLNEPARGAEPQRPLVTLRVPDEIPPPAPYEHREPDVRERLVETMGGSAETEQSVALALDWLARHQSADGSWNSQEFDEGCHHCRGPARYPVDIATTGLSLLSFLAANHTHMKAGPYREVVERGLRWLQAEHARKGHLMGEETLYSHGIGTIALAEALGMTGDATLAPAVESSVAFILSARNTRVGGWRYAPGQIGDTSVLGWQVMAMRSAERAGVAVPAEGFEHAAQWVELVTSKQHEGRYAYQPHRNASPAMTAEAMFVRQLLGHGADEASMRGSAGYLVDHLPDWEEEPNTYYWYYATLALYQNQGAPWSKWNERLKDELLARQISEGPAAGSWPPEDQWARTAGRVYQTAICTLTLEVYYRYLPGFMVKHEAEEE